MTTTIHQTPESATIEPDNPVITPDAPKPPRTTSSSSYFNISWPSALKGVPPALPMDRSNITHKPITLSSPPGGLLFRRRLWNRETDHGRLSDPNGWQGSLANQQRLEAQREINEEWLEERDLSPLGPGVFREVDWKRGATLFEVQVSPRTVVIEGGIVEKPWTQALEAHGSLNNSRRYHARVKANQQWMVERGESPVSVDTFAAVSWSMASSKEVEGSASSPRGTICDFQDIDTGQYERSNSAFSIGKTQYPYPPSSSTVDSLSSFADLISKYNRSSGDGSRSPSSSIGITRYPYPSPSSFGRKQYPYPSPDLENEHSSISLSIDTDEPGDEPIFRTASIALVITPRSSKASMLSAGHASQSRRSPRGSETFGLPLSQDEGGVEVPASHSDLRGPLSPEVRLVVIGGKAVRQRHHGMSESESDSKWSRDSLLSPLPEVEHKRCGVWARTKEVFGKLDCRGASNSKK